MAAIIAENINVVYPVYASPTTQVRHTLLNFATGGRIYGESNRVSHVMAISGVSFRLRDGDRLALIGHNGAGKSTLLRTLAGMLAVSSGTLSITGKISVLFNISNGLDLDKTGRENILGMGLLLGLDRKEIIGIYSDVESFCELGDFMDLPVRTYSDGMKVRLSFAISSSLNPEILILDEAIGAGDARFLKKATERANSLYSRARILVIASHSTAIIRELCNQALVLKQGEMQFLGSVSEALDLYAQE
jgi:ABC-type polysaccharide/polyol phosphate transport system ATPase subunit